MYFITGLFIGRELLVLHLQDVVDAWLVRELCSLGPGILARILSSEREREMHFMCVSLDGANQEKNLQGL